MRDALKRHILRERQRKKEEADANEADKQRRRAEKVFQEFSSLKYLWRRNKNSFRILLTLNISKS
jgi:hypothetical protein